MCWPIANDTHVGNSQQLPSQALNIIGTGMHAHRCMIDVYTIINALKIADYAAISIAN